MSTFFEKFFKNHVLANLFFVMILAFGLYSFLKMPQEQDPAVNFNWIDITTIVPGMTAVDIEKQVTDVLEDDIRTISDIKFVSSNSRESVSSVVVRFDEISTELFNKRLAELRRNVRNVEDDLPAQSLSPQITEITTANSFPSATVVVTGLSDDENLRKKADSIMDDLLQIKGVDGAGQTGLQNKEMHINFDPTQLEAIGISPTAIADTVSLYFQDVSAGTAEVGGQSWSVRLQGTSEDLNVIGDLPIIGVTPQLKIKDVADIKYDKEKPRDMVSYQGKPAVMFSITKQASSNTLELVERLNTYIDKHNKLLVDSGVKIILADDQTMITRKALSIMETNAVLGLILVMLVAWLFLGFKIALFTSIGIPFILAGTFIALHQMGQTLNVTVLLGVVISLGMLVDDAVVVVESIYYRLQRGHSRMDSVMIALKEVTAPVTTAVLTTMAAFLPLMLLPGILGSFMMVIPLVVTTALAISLIEAFWMLPSHILASNVNFSSPSKIQETRKRYLHKIRLTYSKLLVKSMRYPRALISGLVLVFILSVLSAVGGQVFPSLQQHPVVKYFLVKTDFFASDALRLFYVSVEMPNGTPLESTMEVVKSIENKVSGYLDEEEVRAVVSYAGEMFTETAPSIGDHYGQILVTLNPKEGAMRSVAEVVNSMRKDVSSMMGPDKIFFLELAGGPPTSKAINVKVRGDDIDQLRAATAELKDVLLSSGFAHDISDDDSSGLKEMVLNIDKDRASRSGILPSEITRAVRLMVDGEVVASLRQDGEKVEIRVKVEDEKLTDIQSSLDISLPAVTGELVPLRSLVTADYKIGVGNIRHYDFRRTITIEGEIDNTLTDTLTANNYIKQEWAKIESKYPAVNLDFAGQLDDIEESLDSMFTLMLFGVLLMYAILGTQFGSYFQPLMILASVPMAFTGVVAGLLLTHNPLSLYTLYGVIALVGIAVNAAIVLISTANQFLDSGMSILHATVYAARRRVIPILITSLTTVAGLLSLATGLGGESLIWGPVATAIVWGVVVSSTLTLLVIPLLYRIFMPYSHIAENQKDN